MHVIYDVRNPLSNYLYIKNDWQLAYYSSVKQKKRNKLYNIQIKLKRKKFK